LLALERPPIESGSLSSAEYLIRLYNGERPDLEAFMERFCLAAGADIGPIVQSLLASQTSLDARCLLVAALGYSRRPDVAALLRSAVEEGSSLAFTSISLYALGLVGTPECRGFLAEYWTAIRRKNIGDLRQATAAALGLCGPSGLKVLLESAREDCITGRPYLRGGLEWNYLSLVRSADAFDELRAVATGGDDDRIRRMAINAIARSPDVGQRGYLAELYEGNTTVQMRRVLLDALLRGHKLEPGNWTNLKANLQDAFERVLKASPPPTGDVALDSMLMLISGNVMGTEGAQTVKATASAVRDRSFLLHCAASWSFRDDPVAFKEWLDSSGATGSEKLGLMLTMYGMGHTELKDAATTDEFLRIIRGTDAPALRGRAAQILMELGADQASLSDALAQWYNHAEDANGRLGVLDVISRAQSTKTSATSPLDFLRGVVTKEQELWPRVCAASLLMQSPSRDEATFAAIEPLAARGVWATQLDGGIIRAKPQSVAALAHFIGSYYSARGKDEDIAWLQQLPNVLVPTGASDWETVRDFKEYLVSQCNRAVDAIRLRKP
jgi:hypothetical protein